MEALILLIAGAVNILCFIIGARVGQRASNGETIDLPKIDPVSYFREQKDKKQADKEQERIDTIMRNIEGYDGTSRGQEEVPKG
jgi:hypothetical protein